MSYISRRLRFLVIERASGSCEYCLVHADYAAFVHEIDHVIAKKHGGATTADNLAYACAQCNRFKGSNVAAVDPQTGDIVPLFNPRTQQWRHHFQLDGAMIVPLTLIGRATERLLQLLTRLTGYCCEKSYLLWDVFRIVSLLNDSFVCVVLGQKPWATSTSLRRCALPSVMLRSQRDKRLSGHPGC